MAENFNLSDSVFSYYVFFNWACWFLSAFLLARFFLYKKYLFVKPSMLLLSYTHFFLQLPATIYSSYYESYLPHPIVFALLIHGYVVVGLFVNSSTFHVESQTIWNRICSYKSNEPPISMTAVLFLGGMATTVITIYLRFVPLQSTGLYVMLVDPISSSMSSIAREESLKLLDNPLLIYAYTIFASSIAPLLTAMLILAASRSIARKRILSALVPVSLIPLLLVAVSFTGARVSAVNLLFVIAMVFFFKNKLTINPVKLIFGLGAILFPAVLLSMFREGKDFDYQLIPMYFGFIARRVFLIPLDVGSWYVHYAQTAGVFGVNAVPKLAALFGVASIDAPNFIANVYDIYFTETSSAGSGYIFSYYSYMGLASIPLTIASISFLDVALLAYKRLSDYLLLPCVAAISLSTMAFVSADYTAVFLTHGFGVILILSFITDKIVKLRSPVHNPICRSNSAV